MAVDCNHPQILPALDPFSGKLIGSFDAANFLQIGAHPTAEDLRRALDERGVLDRVRDLIT